tara:strand:+ start:48 stop:266 length:219 start_codon:yes stop_codon:yes gene_type:complete
MDNNLLNSGRPQVSAREAVNYCIGQLNEWEDMYAKFPEEICPALTYEELIGALLQAHDAIEQCAWEHEESNN